MASRELISKSPTVNIGSVPLSVFPLSVFPLGVTNDASARALHTQAWLHRRRENAIYRASTSFLESKM
jgi:hypothetical protein